MAHDCRGDAATREIHTVYNGKKNDSSNRRKIAPPVNTCTGTGTDLLQIGIRLLYSNLRTPDMQYGALISQGLQVYKLMYSSIPEKN